MNLRRVEHTLNLSIMDLSDQVSCVNSAEISWLIFLEPQKHYRQQPVWRHKFWISIWKQPDCNITSQSSCSLPHRTPVCVTYLAHEHPRALNNAQTHSVCSQSCSQRLCQCLSPTDCSELRVTATPVPAGAALPWLSFTDPVAMDSTV